MELSEGPRIPKKLKPKTKIKSKDPVIAENPVPGNPVPLTNGDVKNKSLTNEPPPIEDESSQPQPNKNKGVTRNSKLGKKSAPPPVDPVPDPPVTQSPKLSVPDNETKEVQVESFRSCLCGVTVAFGQGQCQPQCCRGNQGQMTYLLDDNEPPKSPCPQEVSDAIPPPPCRIRGSGEENPPNSILSIIPPALPIMYKTHIQDYFADCDKSNNCDNMSIILGQLQKDKVTAVGQELLLMGKRVLKEIDFAGSPLCKLVCPDRAEIVTTKPTCPEKCNQTKDPCSNFEPVRQCCQCEPEPKRRSMVEQQQAMSKATDARSSRDAKSNEWICDIEPIKKKFAEEVDKIYAKMTELNVPHSHTLSSSQVEDKVEEIIEAIGPPDVDENEKRVQQLADRLTLLEGKFTELDDQVGELISTVLKQNTGMTSKMANLEDNILFMAKLINDLQCVTKLQMHIGSMTPTDPSTETVPTTETDISID